MREVFLVQGKRSPLVKSGLDLKDTAAPFLAHYLTRRILDETLVPDDAVDEVIIGNIGSPAKYSNVARVVALEAGLDKKTPAYTVNRNCAASMEAIAQGSLRISSGRSEIIFAGGVENMGQIPLYFSKEMTNLFFGLMKAKTLAQKIAVMASFRPSFLKPVVAIEQGLTDPFCGLNMGQTAELIARELGISREEQDIFANQSHHKTVAAKAKHNEDIVPIIVGAKLDRLLDSDVGPRADSTAEGLGRMKPYFDRVSGTVTIGNSCPITDGGAMCLLASGDAVKKHNLKPIARIVNYAFAGLEPERMGLGPVLAMEQVLRRTELSLDAMDLVELNEAFAAQVLACLKILKDDSLCQKMGLEKAVGEIPLEKLNVNGGAIALGHPVGATGARLIVTLAHELRRRKLRYGLATLCIGGGQGGAMIIENLCL